MVPNGWIKTDLNPFIDIKHGFAFKSEYFREEGNYVLLTPGSFYEPGGFRDQKSKTKYYVGDIPKGYLLSKGELLVAMTEQAAGLLGSTLFVPSHDRYLHNQRLGLIQIKDKNGICPEFLYLTYNSPYIRKQIAEQSTGTKVKHTSPDKLKSVICLLPPLPEQRKIAQILSTWDRSIATTEKLIDASKQQKKALMQQLLTGKKRLLDPETGKAFEGEWEEVKLGDLSSKITKGTTPSTNGFQFQESGINFVKVESILKTGKFEKSKFAYIDEDCHSAFKRSQLEEGDILFSIAGALGRTAIVTIDILPANTNQALSIVRLKKNSVCSAFVTQYLNCSAISATVKGLTAQAAQPNLSLKDVGNLPINLPSYSEQQKITSVLTAADKEIELLEAKLAHLKQEKKALMQQLLTGKRRVKVTETEAA